MVIEPRPPRPPPPVLKKVALIPASAGCSPDGRTAIGTAGEGDGVDRSWAGTGGATDVTFSTIRTCSSVMVVEPAVPVAVLTNPAGGAMVQRDPQYEARGFWIAGVRYGQLVGGGLA